MRRQKVQVGLTPKGNPSFRTVEVLEPVDYTVHVNPVSVGFGALAVGVGLAGLALAAWWSGLALDPIPTEERRHKKDILAFKRRQLKEAKEALAAKDLSLQNKANLQKTVTTLQGDIRNLARETRFPVRLEKRERFKLFGI